MQMIKYFMLILVFISSSLIGRLISKKYIDRVEELKEIKNALNIFKSKIKFTYEPLQEIFKQISNMVNKNIGNIFKNAKDIMKEKTAAIAWEEAVENSNTNLKEEDLQVLKNLSKLLGISDIDGQISQIDVTESFIERQLREAEQEKQKNVKLYKMLGNTIGLAIVIILI